MIIKKTSLKPDVLCIDLSLSFLGSSLSKTKILSLTYSGAIIICFLQYHSLFLFDVALLRECTNIKVESVWQLVVGILITPDLSSISVFRSSLAYVLVGQGFLRPDSQGSRASCGPSEPGTQRESRLHWKKLSNVRIMTDFEVKKFRVVFRGIVRLILSGALEYLADKPGLNVVVQSGTKHVITLEGDFQLQQDELSSTLSPWGVCLPCLAIFELELERGSLLDSSLSLSLSLSLAPCLSPPQRSVYRGLCMCRQCDAPHLDVVELKFGTPCRCDAAQVWHISKSAPLLVD